MHTAQFNMVLLYIVVNMYASAFRCIGFENIFSKNYNAQSIRCVVGSDHQWHLWDRRNYHLNGIDSSTHN